jgi:hypothetical protein
MRRQMASPIENYLQQVRHPLALRARSPSQPVCAVAHCIAQRNGASEASGRTPPMGYCERFSIRDRLQKFMLFFNASFSL